MTETTNYKLKKPSQNDYYNVDDFNFNADTIDAALKEKADINSDGKIPASQLPEGSAESITYDNTNSKLEAENVQAAIDALKTLLSSINFSVDSALSDTSENPVQNKIIKAALDAISKSLTTHASDTTKHITDAEREAWNGKSDGDHKHSGTDITSGLDALKTAMGLDGAARIQTGSYTGTGTSGSSNPCRLTFNFVPKVFFVYMNYSSDTYAQNSIMWSGSVNPVHMKNEVVFSLSGNTLSYYSSTAFSQFNNSGDNYGWVAIG